MHPLEKSIASMLADPNRERSRLLVGVSGGADSVALLRGLHRSIKSPQTKLHVAHYHHGTRESAGQDQQWVRGLCQKLDLPFSTNEIEDTAADQPLSQSENSLRERRYRFLQQVASQENCRFLALAHHADDQVETLLHHLIRGTGLRGLVGIPAQRKLNSELMILRPLLGITRHEILQYLHELRQDHCSDETNADCSYTRNRIRQELLPQLESYNPQMRAHLLELSRQATETQAYHQQLIAATIRQALLSAHAQAIRLLNEPLREMPIFLRRELFVELWEQHRWPRQKMTARDWQHLAELTETTTGRLELPAQITAERRAKLIVLTREE